MKRQVAQAAAQRVESGMVLGLGSGSTAAVFIELLGQRWRSGELTGIQGVPTSFQAAVLAQEFGIPQITLNEIDRIDLAVDGADEVDPARNLIKGGGACHTREKLVASRADRFVVVVDETKLSAVLGSNFALPVEVLPEAYRQVMGALAGMGAVPELRMAVRKAGPVVTDQGNLVIDAKFDAITDPAGLESQVNNLPGVLENGLFVGLADEVLVGVVHGDDVAVESR
ncbi:MAG TPA: ribose-5-phosphate isomerase RpiA [Actinomycetota bacterium]|nr:ribose-5-phosphate isomerase RpiA [Actinomycetota bacterium]